MRVKQILSDVRRVIADIEVSHNGALRSNGHAGQGPRAGRPAQPDGRPILMNRNNGIDAPK